METSSRDLQVARNSERASQQGTSRISQEFNQTLSREQSQHQPSIPSMNSNDTDLEERVRLDQQVLSYGLDRLVDDRTFMDIFLELHSLCSKTGLSV